MMNVNVNVNRVGSRHRRWVSGEAAARHRFARSKAGLGVGPKRMQNRRLQNQRWCDLRRSWCAGGGGAVSRIRKGVRAEGGARAKAAEQHEARTRMGQARAGGTCHAAVTDREAQGVERTAQACITRHAGGV